MTNEEILKKAIEKAVKNGYVGYGSQPMGGEILTPQYEYEPWLVVSSNAGAKEVIFSHSFAKAFWGDRYMTPEEEDKEVGLNQTVIMPRWQYHLQQMVLKEDPIKYLEKYL